MTQPEAYRRLPLVWARAFSVLLVLVLFVSAGISVWRIIDKGLGNHPTDLYSYWYPAHFLWQGRDPYVEWQSGNRVQGSVRHMDQGTVPAAAIQNPGWTYIPANTAPVLLLLSPLALVSFPRAIVVWGLANGVLVCLVAWLVTKLVGIRLWSANGLTVLCLLLVPVATREVFEYGQTTLLITACTFAALALCPRHPYLAGLVTGVALSKYSLAIALALFLIYKRQYIVLGIAFAVQLLGVLIVNLVGGTTPLDTLSAYGALLVTHYALPGINLQGSLLYMQPSAGIFAVGMVSLFLVVGLWRWQSQGAPVRFPSGSLSNSDLLLFSIVLVWSLLAVYHRLYDELVILLPLALLLFKSPKLEASLPGARLPIHRLLLIGVGCLAILPFYFWLTDQAYVSLLALTNLLLLALLMFTLLRMPRHVLTSAGSDS